MFHEENEMLLTKELHSRHPSTVLLSLICPDCSLVLRDAVWMGDGVRLCESCFNQDLYQ